MARDDDPLGRVDWATFGRTVGGRVRALDDEHPDPEIARRWSEAGKRTLPLVLLPRWRWIALCLILVIVAGVIFGGLTFLGDPAH